MAAFKAGAQNAAKRILANFKDYDLYISEENPEGIPTSFNQLVLLLILSTPGQVVLLNYRSVRVIPSLVMVD